MAQPYSCFSQETSPRMLPNGTGKRIVLLYAGGENGFLPNSDAWFHDQGDCGYHSIVDGESFERWFSSLLGYVNKKNLSNTVIITESARCHSRMAEGVPKSDARKQVLIEPLNSLNESGENIIFDSKSSRRVLWEIVKQERTPFPYIPEKLAKDKGHIVLRTPPCHPELQPGSK
eukprot:GCRY01008489.1.p1 GENE.GCRY01008489.1~~GCRY01008489.1.p1  ORF type:complete len:192 (-),score=16.01 GCRY01008489.1:18-539(-)